MCAVPPETGLPTASSAQLQRAPVEEIDATVPELGSDDEDAESVSNEYVLNVAFLSFLLFTTLQFFFAVIAKSQSMMADCAAMYVDVVTYLFNFFAERLKHGHSGMSARQLRLRRLYLELVPPFISVTTLLVVTILALREAFDTLALDEEPDEEDAPDVFIMLVFSALNLLLDVLNVSCFARVHQAIGLGPSQDGHNVRHSHHHEDSEATENTPLVSSDEEESVESEESGSLNLNMCSAWTHICADTLRSIAVLLAAGFSYCFPSLLTAADADSWGAVVVSVIILVSLAPLFQGLYLTADKIRVIWFHESSHHKDIVLTV